MMIAILIVVTVVALFDLAAIAWGVDTSDAAADPRDRVRPSI
jgi:hypothetical protein